MSVQYKIYITPKSAGSTYGTEVEVSGYIIDSGVAIMRRSIDAGDYEIGVYTYGDVALKVVNENGYLNENDSRSIFIYGRDKAKVRITYDDGTTETNVFRGLINDEATRQNLDDDIIEFKVLSLDSVIRSTEVAGGLLTNGTLASTAIKAILNQADITAILNYSASNINVGFDFTVDVASELENRSCRDSLNELLFATNSVFLVDSSNNMIVKARDSYGPNFLFLKGPYAQHADQNILDVTLYNSGRHRMFNSVMVNDQQHTQTSYVGDYSFRQKEIEFSFITNNTTEGDIAEQLSDEFKLPKIECNVRVPTYEAVGFGLTDLVSIDWPLRTKPYENTFMPIVGATTVGDAAMPLPWALGSLSIHPNVAFKIIEMDEDPKNFTTLIKLRQTGKDHHDGYFTTIAASIVGFAVVDESVVGAGADPCQTWNPSVVGAAYTGCTEVA